MEIGVPSVLPSNVPGKYPHPVRLLARADDGRLPRTPAVQVRLDVRLSQRQPRRAAIDHDADAAPVRFAPGGDAKQMSK